MLPLRLVARKSTVLFGVGLFVSLICFYWQWLTDTVTFYLFDNSLIWEPFFAYLGDSFRHGRFPLWNPYLLSGGSELAVMAPSPFYIMSWLFASLPFSSALATILLVDQFIAGLGLFLLLRSAGWGTAAAVFGGAAFGLSSVLFSLEATSAIHTTVSWLPLAIWSLGQVEQPSLHHQLKRALFLVLPIYFLISPGVPELFSIELFVLALYSLWLWQSSHAASKTRIFLLRLAALVIGVLLCAPSIVPVAEWVPLSDRAWGLDLQQVVDWSSNWYDLVNLFLPHALGDQQLVTNPFIGLTAGSIFSVRRYITSSYLGPIVITLAVVGFSDRTWRLRPAVFVATFFALLLSLGKNFTPVLLLIKVLKLSAFRYPIKLLTFASLGAFIAAARGIVVCLRNAGKRECLALAGAWSVIVLCCCFLSPPRTAAAAAVPFAALLGLPIAAVPQLGAALSIIARDGALHCLLGVLSSLALLAVQLKAFSAKKNLVITGAIVLLIGVDLYQARSLFHHGAPRTFYSEPLLLAKYVEPLRGATNSPRLFRLISLVLNSRAPASFSYTPSDPTCTDAQYERQNVGVPGNLDFRVSEPFRPVVGQTVEAFRWGGYAFQQMEKGNYDPLLTYCRMNSVNTVFQNAESLHPDGTLEHTNPPIDIPGFELVEFNQACRIRVYRVTHVLPRMYFAQSVKWGSPHEQVLRLVSMTASDVFDPSRLTILEHTRSGEKSPHTNPLALSSEETISVVADEPENIRLKATTGAGRYLILTDTFYPGWSATIDGLPTVIYRANALGRAVYVPPGVHSVEFSYRPISLLLGLVLGAVGVLMLITLASAAWLSRKRSVPSVEKRL